MNALSATTERMHVQQMSSAFTTTPAHLAQHRPCTQRRNTALCSSRDQGRNILPPVCVMTPARISAAAPVTSPQPGSHLSMTTSPSTHMTPEQILGEVMAPVKADLQQLNENLLNIAQGRHHMLVAAAQQIFGAGGKKLRPVIVFLVARATARTMNLGDINQKHRSLAEITEMIHTASLVHDDVLDEAQLRRGRPTVNAKYNTRLAVLAGDYLFAQSSWGLALLENIEVIKLISKVIADFANGEISQAENLFKTNVELEQYLEKSDYKTASLIAASCRSAAVFSDAPESLKQAMYDYGRHLGLAFQVVDDILDFTQSTEQLGKPQGQDLASGNLTAPVIYALENPEVKEELEQIIENDFIEEGSLQRALRLVEVGGGIERSRQLARREADAALACLESLTDCPEKRSLQFMVEYVLQRIY